MHDVPYTGWADFVERWWGERPPASRTVLDLACGTANSTLPWLDRGWEAVGVDASEAMLAVARAKLAGRAELILADATTLDLGRRFGLVWCVFDSINYLLDPADALRLIERAALHAEPGGVVAVDANTPYGLENLWDAPEVGEELGATEYHWIHSFERETQIASVRCKFRVRREDGTWESFEETHQERGYQPEFLAEAFAHSGLAGVAALEFPGGERAGPLSRRAWILGRKPGSA
jgi:SAM-dependent methyltransferase